MSLGSQTTQHENRLHWNIMEIVFQQQQAVQTKCRLSIEPQENGEAMSIVNLISHQILTNRNWFVPELSPKFNCCKMEYLFILRFKGPLLVSMFGKRLSFKQFWLCLFLNGLRDFGCRAPFLSLVLLPAFLQGFIQSVSVPPLQHVTLRGGRACMFLQVDGRCLWFFLAGQSTCCKFQKCFKQSCKNELVFMRQPLQ